MVLRNELSRLRSIGVKINADFLCRTVILLARCDQNFTVSEHDVIEATGKKPSETIYLPWIYHFCHAYNIKNCIRTGNKSLSFLEVGINKKYLAYHLGRLKRSHNNSLDESAAQNFDETHIVVDMNKGRY